MSRLLRYGIGIALAGFLPCSEVLADKATDKAADKATDNSDAVKADNTKVNKRDRQEVEPTADQQKNKKSDVQLAAQIRRAVFKDKALSMYAHNVKIIVQKGIVTLKGPVRSEEEKKSIEAKAVEVAGQANVKNEIDIAPKK